MSKVNAIRRTKIRMNLPCELSEKEVIDQRIMADDEKQTTLIHDELEFEADDSDRKIEKITGGEENEDDSDK